MLLELHKAPSPAPHKVDRILDSLDAQNRKRLHEWLTTRDADGKFKTSTEAISYSLRDAGINVSPSWVAHWRRGHVS